MDLSVPCGDNVVLERVVQRAGADEGLAALLRCANVNAINRLKYSDHGAVHSKIVANLALRILRLLAARGVQPSLVKDHGLTLQDSEVALYLAAIMHDVGMALHRKEHERLGVVLATLKMHELLRDVYTDEKRWIVVSEALHAAFVHEVDSPPLTIEAGVLKVADALDMAEGRARIPFQKGKSDIHAVSAMAIEGIKILEGGSREKPVVIEITMSNSAGVFQIDGLLKPRLLESGLKDYIEVRVRVRAREKPIVTRYEM